MDVTRLEGRQIGAYKVGPRAGEGGMAFVYRGYHTETKEPVALKVLLPEHAADHNIRERFKREAKTLQRLRHQHIVSVYELLQEQEAQVMVMEWVEGQELRALLKENPRGLSYEQIALIFPPILQALDYAHSQKVIHRDLKPSNILLQKQGEVEIPKVMDFGVAKVLEASYAPTSAGTFLGTLSYMAPEQGSASKGIDHRVDVYAMGVLLFECLTGRLPFQGKTVMEILSGHLFQEVPPMRVFRADLSPAFDEFMAKAMAKKPDDRFDDCIAFSNALVDLVQPKVTHTIIRNAPAEDIDETIEENAPALLRGLQEAAQVAAKTRPRHVFSGTMETAAHPPETFTLTRENIVQPDHTGKRIWLAVFIVLGLSALLTLWMQQLNTPTTQVPPVKSLQSDAGPPVRAR